MGESNSLLDFTTAPSAPLRLSQSNKKAKVDVTQEPEEDFLSDMKTSE